MNYTEKYHLPQWEETDRIMRVDFNQMCADIDEGIHTAQETAETLPYVVGSYMGTGAVQTVLVGFMPSFVIIFTSQAADNYVRAPGRVCVCGRMMGAECAEMIEGGFRLSAPPSIYPYPKYNDPDTQFQYVAFR